MDLDFKFVFKFIKLDQNRIPNAPKWSDWSPSFCCTHDIFEPMIWCSSGFCWRWKNNKMKNTKNDIMSAKRELHAVAYGRHSTAPYCSGQEPLFIFCFFFFFSFFYLLNYVFWLVPSHEWCKWSILIYLNISGQNWMVGMNPLTRLSHIQLGRI